MSASQFSATDFKWPQRLLQTHCVWTGPSLARTWKWLFHPFCSLLTSPCLPQVSFTALTCLTIHWIISINQHTYCDFFYLIRYNKINILNQVSPASNHPSFWKLSCSTSPGKRWCPCSRVPPHPHPQSRLISAHSEEFFSPSSHLNCLHSSCLTHQQRLTQLITLSSRIHGFQDATHSGVSS